MRSCSINGRAVAVQRVSGDKRCRDLSVIMPSMMLRFCLTMALMLSLACCASAHAGTNARILQLQHTQWHTPVDLREHRETRLLYGWRGHNTAGYALFSYQPLRLSGRADTEQPAHNGHLYEYAVGIQRQWQAMALELDTGAHISSNMFIHGRFHREALVTTFRLWAGQDTDDWRPGVAGDYRFGRFMLYPQLQTVVSAAGGQMNVDLPVSIVWRSGDGRFSAGMERYGQKWGVLDSERVLESRLYHSEWRLKAGWHLPTAWHSTQLDLGLGISVDRQMRFTSTSNRAQRYRPGNSIFASVGFRLPR